MADKSLVMTFLNSQGSRSSLTIAAVKDNVTEAEVISAMDAVIAANIFETTGGDLVAKHAAEITERNVTPLDVK
jgi:hypothetical protein